MPRTGTLDDAPLIGRMLDAFNREFDDYSPGPEPLAARVRELMASGDTAIALADGDAGFALMRFRPNLWSAALECYLAELYILPEHRGDGLGRALMDHVLDLARERGADHIDLATGENDHAAQDLYESLGFTNREGGPADDTRCPLMYMYERSL